MNNLFTLVLLIVLTASCARSIIMVNGKGEVIRCTTTETAQRDSCVRDARAHGYFPENRPTTGLHLDWKTRPPVIDDVAGPALKAGIRAGDVLTHIDDQEITDEDSVLALVGHKEINEPVKLQVRRGTENRIFMIAMAQRGGLNIARAPIKPLNPAPPRTMAPSASNAPASGQPPAAKGSPVSFINAAGSTLTCPPASSEDDGNLNSCAVNAESRGFVRIPEVSAGIGLDWNSKPLKIAQVSGNAAAAGVQKGDVLLEVDGNRIVEPITIFRSVGDKRPGDYVIVTVLRGGKSLTFTYQLVAKE